MLGRRSYEQCDGVAMSSLLGPALANVFMCHFENVCLENCQTPNFKLTAYRRFLDYTILLFWSNDHVESLNIISTKNIKT